MINSKIKKERINTYYINNLLNKISLQLSLNYKYANKKF